MAKILDCTLRDGGYYNAWDFDVGVVRRLIAALVDAGVDVVELGYKSVEMSGFNGLFRFCDEAAIRRLLPTSLGGSQLAFMVDAKEFLVDANTANVRLLEAVVSPSAESVFSFARVATHPATIKGARHLVEQLKRLGYTVALNIMGISTLDEQQLRSALACLEGAPIDVLYLADSYGSLTPSQAVEKVKALRAGFPGEIGVHMHENQGLALANTLASIEAGATYVDSTLSGMGRGAGNARTEQLLLSMYFQHGRHDLKPAAVLPSLERDFLPLQREYGWGWDSSYMLSGLVEIHPTYCQEIKTGARYDVEDVAAILGEIPAEKRARFDEKELLAAEQRFQQKQKAAAGEVEVADRYVAPSADEVLVVANGPSMKRHADALRTLALQSALCLECNDTGVLDGLRRTTLAMNPIRIAEMCVRLAHDAVRVLAVGARHVPGALAGEAPKRVDFALLAGRFSVGDASTPPTLPGFVVGMLAVAMALQARPKRILLAGFDGFVEVGRRAEHAEMESFWNLVRDVAGDVELLSVTPTTYELPTTSVYALLQQRRAASHMGSTR